MCTRTPFSLMAATVYVLSGNNVHQSAAWRWLSTLTALHTLHLGGHNYCFAVVWGYAWAPVGDACRRQQIPCHGLRSVGSVADGTDSTAVAESGW